MISNQGQNKSKHIRPRFILILLLICVALYLSESKTIAQNQVITPEKNQQAFLDSTAHLTDTLSQTTDTLRIDSTLIGKKKAVKPILEAPVKYESEDSLIFSVSQQKVYLYKTAKVDYMDINLKAGHMEFDYGTKVVMAAGTKDSANKLTEKPEFMQKEEKFNCDTMRYNFDTHKGVIKNIITQQGEGYLHSGRTKRLGDGEIDISKGKYTTCDAEHPHFYIALTKAISIPKKRIVSGPAYLVFEDIPMPLGLPFGFFPNTNKRTSGFIIPGYTDQATRGFGLENGGWYFALNDYIDVTVLGSTYTRGTWGISTSATYDVRYKYSGQFSAQFFDTRVKDDPSIAEVKDFKINWSHTQDPKANPTRKFSASVDFSTSSYEKNEGHSIKDLLTNQKTSSIAYSKNWGSESPFHFSANLNGTQNTSNHDVNITLPAMTFSMDGIYPFRSKKDKDGEYNWLQNIQISYSSKLINSIATKDSNLFTHSTWKNMKNGFSHNIPISLKNIKLFNLINVTPSVSYSGVLYTNYIEKSVRGDTMIYKGGQVIDTINKITYAHAVSASIGFSVSPKLYGTFVNTRRNPYLIAVRHVMSPMASFGFSPDMKGLVPNYYRKVASSSSIEKETKDPDYYSIYEKNVYGTPTVNGKSGSVSLSLGNSLEAKVRSKEDTTGQGKKVVILQNLNFSTRYNPFAKGNEFKWGAVNMTGATTLYKNKVNVTFGSNFDPYALDSTGKQKINKFLLNETGKLFRITSANLSINFSLQSSSGKKKGGSPTQKTTSNQQNENATMNMLNNAGGTLASSYVDFDIPWSLSVGYTWSYYKPTNRASYTHAVDIRGDISLTPKWKIGGGTGYDFVARKFTTTNISIHRDLHCWEMRMMIIPFGNYKSYNFTINAKSSILRDLKWDKKRTWNDKY